MSKTITSRLEIGFENLKEDWSSASVEYDEEGSLKILGHPVMERWEENYMEELAKVACRKGGKILEVGFGLGISASKIQQHEIESHVIIEANCNVFSKLLKFTQNVNHKVIGMVGFWEECTEYLESESFDGILFDTYPLSAKDIHKNHFPFFKTAYRLLKKGGILTYYSDEKLSFSNEHMKVLKDANFTNIDYRICNLQTPDKCKYWENDTMIVPIITK